MKIFAQSGPKTSTFFLEIKKRPENRCAVDIYTGQCEKIIFLD